MKLPDLLRIFASDFSLALLLGCVVSTSAVADDWPQWMGPTRDGVYRETGIVDAIAKDGLPVKWRTPVHGGYAGPAVVGDRVFLMDYQRTAGEMVESPGARPKQSGIERVLSFDAKTGAQVWSHEYECNYEISFPAGPRVTPTVVDGLVVALGAEGDLTVLSADTGELKWHVNIPKQFGVTTPVWGFAAHPLVTKGKVITMVGGDDHAVVAFDRENGEVVWHSLSSSDAGYCPPSLVDAGGTEQLLIWHPESVASLNPISGEPYWSEPLQPQGGMSIARPQREDDLLFVGGFKNASLMLRLMPDRPAVDVVWESEVIMSLSPSTMTPLIHDGIIYGCDNELGALLAVRASDGKRLWQSYLPIRPSNVRRLRSGTCFVTRHEPSGRYLLFGEMGTLTIVSMDAEKLRPHGQMQVLEPTQSAIGRKVIWSHPAYANKTAYIRNDNELVAVDLSVAE